MKYLLLLCIAFGASACNGSPGMPSSGPSVRSDTSPEYMKRQDPRYNKAMRDGGGTSQ